MKTKSKFSPRTLLLVAMALAYFVPAWNSKATTHIITFTYYYYSPNQLTVAVGDTIIWQGAFLYHPLRTVWHVQLQMQYSRWPSLLHDRFF